MKSMRPSPLHEYISRATRTLVMELISSLVPWRDGRDRVSHCPGNREEKLGISEPFFEITPWCISRKGQPDHSIRIVDI